jgi:hypothetical protein
VSKFRYRQRRDENGHIPDIGGSSDIPEYLWSRELRALRGHEDDAGVEN